VYEHESLIVRPHKGLIVLVEKPRTGFLALTRQSSKFYPRYAKCGISLRDQVSANVSYFQQKNGESVEISAILGY